MTKINDALLIKIAHAMDGPWNRSRFIDLLVELGLYKISDFQQGGIIRNYNFILEILQVHANLNFLREINERKRFPKEILRELLEAGIDLSKADDTEEAPEPQKLIALNSKTRVETQAKKEAMPVKSAIENRKKYMSEEHPEVKAAKISARSMIIVAIISLVSALLGALINSFARNGGDQPPPTPVVAYLAIEQIPSRVFPYAGDAENKGGTSTMRIILGDTAPAYLLRYNLPNNQLSGYAGLTFRFESGQNVSAYNAIEFTIQFSEKDETIDLYLNDIAKAKSSIRIVSTGAEEMNVTYPLSNFKNLSLNAIQEVTFNVDSTFVTGSHEIVVKNIRFVP